MIDYDKTEVKESLEINDYFELLIELGGDPEYSSFGIISSTICHNKPGEGSRKLYFYSNSGLFQCWTGCDSFDVFELIIKVAEIQWQKTFDLNDAVRWVARRFGIMGTQKEVDKDKLKDWEVLSNYSRIQEIEVQYITNITLKEYDSSILDRFNYSLKIGPWLDEGISQNIIEFARIGFYPGGDQITIPHFDKDGRFIGLRGRTLCKEEAELYGKYRPIKICNEMYNHPLGLNLYGLNWAKDNIKKYGKAIIFESEKSVLKYLSIFGIENNISVACCGSSVSNYAIQSLIEAGANEIIIALDRQFKKIGDDEFNHLKKNLLKIREKYKHYATISFIFDKNMITNYKSSPIDEGKEKFLKLFSERIVL